MAASWGTEQGKKGHIFRCSKLGEQDGSFLTVFDPKLLRRDRPAPKEEGLRVRALRSIFICLFPDSTDWTLSDQLGMGLALDIP